MKFIVKINNILNETTTYSMRFANIGIINECMHISCYFRVTILLKQLIKTIIDISIRIILNFKEHNISNVTTVRFIEKD